VPGNNFTRQKVFFVRKKEEFIGEKEKGKRDKIAPDLSLSQQN
jgi:hypothetical protein